MITPDSIAYVSGPMTGLPDYNRTAFYDAEWLLFLLFGCRVLNPARQPDGLTWEQYMRNDLEMLSRATVIVLLPGWERSKGARIELDLATMHGIPAVEIGDLLRRAA